jgi:5-dehydro-4-deoxyglucarate dehydratase
VTTYTPPEIADAIGSGLLSFPVTHFSESLEFDEPSYRDHLAWLAEYPVAGLFAAGGTGEFFSLTAAEVDTVIRVAVAEVAGRVPVLAPAGGGTRTAVDQAIAAEDAGAAGVLLFPPYLTEASQDGLAAHVRAVCDATRLGIVVYHRANARFTVRTLEALADACPNLIGFKDGIGDIEVMTKIYATLGDRLTYIGGLPTAETFALPYVELGVTTYSSALFNFVPEFAVSFYDSVRTGDRVKVYDYLRRFVLPYVAIRDRAPGYAVSIVKAGLDAVGRRGGRVRPPLESLTAEDRAELAALIRSFYVTQEGLGR